VTHREAFGAEFLGAEGFLNSPTYGLPPRFLADALDSCMRQWQTGTMEPVTFDEPVNAGRAAYAALAGVPVESVALGRLGVRGAGTGGRRDPRRRRRRHLGR
jgi:hypothetical protein